MSHLLSNYEPKVLWDHFYALTQIPRASKNEKAVCEFILNLAEKEGLEASMDNASGQGFGNVIIKVPATPGYENAPTAILQSHVDLVGLPAERHDRPLELILDGDWLRAKGSTLGADNGIGAAIAMAAMTDRSIVHGPLELLFTIDEETGMTGALNLAEDVLQGTMLLNFDSEEEGVLCVGCAGGNRSRIHLPVMTEAVPDGYLAITLAVTGLKGGHSGMEIHKGRANAGKLVTRILYHESPNYDLKLAAINWGSVDNAIPSEAFTTVFIKPEDKSNFEKKVLDWEKIFQSEFTHKEPNLRVTLTETKEKSGFVYTHQSQTKIIQLILSLPHGVAMMSVDIPGLVETSANVAIVKSSPDELYISTSQRSSVAPALDAIIAQAEACAKLAGASIEQGGRYYGWQPNMDSTLLHICAEVYEELFGHKPQVEAIHAGLECGLIGMKYPKLDMISLGPTIRDAHVPTKPDFQPGVDSDTKGERVDVAGMPKFWKYTLAILKRIAAQVSEKHPI